MSMDRRSFLRRLAVGLAATAVDPQALWVPERTIFLPPSGGWYNGGLTSAGLAFHPDAFSLVSEPLLKPGDVLTIEGSPTTWMVKETLDVLRKNLRVAEIINRDYYRLDDPVTGITIRIPKTRG